MSALRSPLAIFISLIVLGLISAAFSLWLALAQPWLGLGPHPATGLGTGLIKTGSAGPAAVIPPGTPLIALGDRRLTPLLLTEDPDMLNGTAERRSFFTDLDQIASALRAGPVTLTGVAGAHWEISAAPRRPLGDLPADFWIQVISGLSGLWLGAWVLSLRPGDGAARALLLAGFGLMLSAHAAAVYSTRELALPAPLILRLSLANFVGAMTFGIGMVTLFSIYPIQLLRGRKLWIVPGIVLIYLAAVAGNMFEPLGLAGLARQLAIAVLMALIVLLVGAQVIATRGAPRARAALGWLGLSVIFGAGGFVVMSILPPLFGIEAQLTQGSSFVFFLLIFIGVALGVARHGLFDLAEWSFALLFYGGGVALLLVMDAILITVLALDRLPAFSLSLLVVAFLYLPLRDMVGTRLGARQRPDLQALFDDIAGVALAPPEADQSAPMNSLLETLFQPLHITPAPAPVARPTLRDGGAVLDFPGVDEIPPSRLSWPARGRRHFGRKDLRRAEAAFAMLEKAVARRHTYKAGIETERQRINRDMHDNLGVQLLGALHSEDPTQKDQLIRQALSDLRAIIAGRHTMARPLSEILADLRAEIGTLFEQAGVALDWDTGALPERSLSPEDAGALRALLREAASNVLRHAEASHTRIAIAMVNGAVQLDVTDNGRGPAGAETATGAGLANMRQRSESRGGRFALAPAPAGGSHLSASLPLSEVSP